MFWLPKCPLSRRAILFCFVLVLSLSGCATAPVAVGLKPDWKSLQQVEHWEMQGRVAFRNENDGWHGRISWVSSPQEDKIKIAGPVGQGAVVILMRDEFAELLFGDGRRQVARDPTMLVEKQLGLPVPLKSLRWWARGLPVEKRPYDMIQRRSDSIVFEQDGWLISQNDFKRYFEKVLPRRIMIEGKGLSLKLVIDRWKEGAGDG